MATEDLTLDEFKAAFRRGLKLSRPEATDAELDALIWGGEFRVDPVHAPEHKVYIFELQAKALMDATFEMFKRGFAA